MSDFFAVFAGMNLPFEISTDDIWILAVCLVGLVFLGFWLLVYGGPRALAGCPVRRNNLPIYLPFIIVVIWIVLVGLAVKITGWRLKGSEQWLADFATYMAVGVIELTMIIAFVIIARKGFARRLKGFGLNWRQIGGDFFAAVVNFIAIWPLVLLAVALVVFVGRAVAGSDFQMPKSEGLTVIIENPRLFLKLVVVVFIVVVVPMFEEMLFRGLLQSIIRSSFDRPWFAILTASIIFATMHPLMHWPALFVLSICMGYAYEKSGSLFRPIFIHAIFNGVSAAGALLS